MQKKTLIQRLIDRYDEYQYNRPKYRIKDLYCGKIDGYIGKDILYNGIYGTEYVRRKKPIQDFAIFYKDANGHLIHIKPYEYIKSEDEASKVSGYFASALVPFVKVYGAGLPFLDLTKNSKISKAFIDYLETVGNSKHNNTMEV